MWGTHSPPLRVNGNTEKGCVCVWLHAFSPLPGALPSHQLSSPTSFNWWGEEWAHSRKGLCYNNTTVLCTYISTHYPAGSVTCHPVHPGTWYLNTFYASLKTKSCCWLRRVRGFDGSTRSTGHDNIFAGKYFNILMIVYCRSWSWSRIIPHADRQLIRF